MTDEELTRRIRASRNMPPPVGAADDWPDAPLPIEPRQRAERIGCTLLIAGALPWLPLLWWIFRHV